MSTAAHIKALDIERAVDAVAAGGTDLVVTRRTLTYRAGTWDLMRVASRTLEDRPILLIQAGLHGDERAGPLTIARSLDAIAQRAHSRGVGLVVYPLANPSGFDGGTRYNADHDRGRAGNGDFLRYRAPDGAWLDEVDDADADWRWSSDVDAACLPVETRALHELLRAEPLARVAGALDLHQDLLSPSLQQQPAAYAYAFPPLHAYARAIERVKRLVPVVADTVIGAGFGVEIDAASGAVVVGAHSRAHPRSDADGFLVRHDGSLTDLMQRIGARYSVAVETTGATPIDVACAVNLAWIEELIELVALTRGR